MIDKSIYGNKKPMPLTDGMIELVKHMRRGSDLCRHSNGYYYLVTLARSVRVKNRDASGLFKRSLLDFDHELFGMFWYKLSDLGKEIKLD